MHTIIRWNTFYSFSSRKLLYFSNYFHVFAPSALDPPTDAQAASQTADSITLEWTNSQADVSSYRVKYSPISGSAHGEKVFPRGSGHTTQATITGQYGKMKNLHCKNTKILPKLLGLVSSVKILVHLCDARLEKKRQIEKKESKFSPNNSETI